MVVTISARYTGYQSPEGGLINMRQPLIPSWRCALLLAGVIIACLLQVANTGSAMDSAPALTEEQIKAFTWFSTLGFPDANGRPFVRVATGWWTKGAGPAENSYLLGLLLDVMRSSIYPSGARTT
jgi:hypothetical protein